MEVIGIGLANIDLISYVSDDFLKRHKIPKAHTVKMDVLPFARMRAELASYDALPGGCAANALCGMAVHGVPTRFFGKIGNDSFESLYRASFSEYTVSYNVEAGGDESSQCAVLVTPDGERSFAYIHGASFDLSPSDLDEAALAQADLIYCEDYIFDFGEGSATAKLVFEAAQQSDAKLAMKMQDHAFSKKYAQKIKTLADAGVLSLVVGNHENLPKLIGAASMEEAIAQFREWKCDVLLTANKRGAYFISGGEVVHHTVSTVVEKPKNTAGAGDQFTAGFLLGRLDEKPVEECMAFGELCARTILMHDTVRPPLVNRHSIRF